MSAPKPRRVVCAANRLTSGDEVFTVCSARHFDPLMRAQMEMSPWSMSLWRSSEQGFIDQFGVFMTRKEALEVARATGQLLYTEGLPTGWLDSSALY